MVARVESVIVVNFVDLHRKFIEHREDQVVKLVFCDSAKVTEVPLSYRRDYRVEMDVPKRNVQQDRDGLWDSNCTVLGERLLRPEFGNDCVAVATPHKLEDFDRITCFLVDATISPRARKFTPNDRCCTRGAAQEKEHQQATSDRAAHRQGTIAVWLLTIVLFFHQKALSETRCEERKPAFLPVGFCTEPFALIGLAD
jgi:hypothetical protein